MSQNTPFVIEPSGIELLTGISPENQRDLRRRGFLDGIGEQTEGGRWKYNAFNALVFWVFRKLVDTGMDRAQAMDPAVIIAGSLVEDTTAIAYLRGNKSPDFETWLTDVYFSEEIVLDRYYVKSLHDGEWKYFSATDLGCKFPFIAPVSYVIDVWWLGKNIPETLSKIIVD